MNTRRIKNGRTNFRQNQLRIIGGIWRGRKFSFPDANGLRPTGDRIRETLFNWLSPWINNANVADLFAGSGVLGIEAVSRGASEALLVEHNLVVAKQIRTSLDLLDDSRLKLVVDDTMHFLRTWKGNPFDIVFLDPPFHQDLLTYVFDLLSRPGILTEGALIYVETSLDDSFPAVPANWSMHRQGQSGNVRFQLFCTN